MNKKVNEKADMEKYFKTLAFKVAILHTINY